MHDDARTKLIKKLLYKSNNRGCKETDIIIGGFATKNLVNMTDDELEMFDYILQLADTDIYDWYTMKKPLPQNLSCELMHKLLNFNPV